MIAFARLLTLAVGLVALAAGPASAQWLRAESPKFIVYSDGGEGDLKDYIQKLESYDRALRLQMGVDTEGAGGRKLPIYLVGDRKDLTQVRPEVGRDVAGFYIASDEDIFAVGAREAGGDFIVLHEYAHHFMRQNFAGSYPSWFVEGFAEYYSTADIAGDRVMLGRAGEWRTHSLAEGQRMDLDILLRNTPGEVTDWRQRPHYYPTAWLLTHYFMSDDGRREQLTAYLTAVGRGADPVEAMEAATGLSLDALDDELSDHLRRRLPYYRLNADFPRQPVTVTRVDRNAGQLLLIGQRLKSWMKEEDRDAALAEVRALTAPMGDDPAALLVLGHAEVHFGDRAEGVEVLKRLVALEPDNAEALQYLASARIIDAEEDGADVEALMAEAQGYLRRAFQADPGAYQTIVLSMQTRTGAPGYPTDGDINNWITAYRLAPQLSSVRIGAGQALLFRDRTAEGKALLGVVANDPHGGAAAEYARNLIETAEAGGEVAAVAPEGLGDEESEEEPDADQPDA